MNNILAFWFNILITINIVSGCITLAVAILSHIFNTPILVVVCDFFMSTILIQFGLLAISIFIFLILSAFSINI